MPFASVGPSALWYLTRATGAVTLLLLTASVVLGVANVGRVQAVGWPRFVIEGVHRNISLLAIVVLLVHVVTSVLDPFASIHVIDAIVPFTSSYRPIWLGLGAFASDLLLAIAITSMVRRHLGHAVWRATHWLAYLCWPVAVLHTVGTGSDIKQLWLLALTAICVIAVIGAVWARVGFGWPAQRGLRGTAFAASVALPAALVFWLPSGPLGADWARRAGTPVSALSSGRTSSTPNSTPSSTPGQTSIAAFNAGVSGTLRQSQGANGLVDVNISLAVANAAVPALALTIVGNAVPGGGVQMTSSTVALGGSRDPTRFTGSITSLSGTNIAANVSAADGHVLALVLSLNIDSSSGSVTGTLQATPNQ
jgi:sulfoxide reductase heme-binding subunit YedZ